MTQVAELGQVRIHRDVRGVRSEYEKFEIGKDLGSAEFRVTQPEIDRFCERTEYHHPYFELDSPFGGTVVPVGMTYATTRLLFSQNYSVRGSFISGHSSSSNRFGPTCATSSVHGSPTSGSKTIASSSPMSRCAGTTRVTSSSPHAARTRSTTSNGPRQKSVKAGSIRPMAAGWAASASIRRLRDPEGVRVRPRIPLIEALTRHVD